jgi:hypothetical protein
MMLPRRSHEETVKAIARDVTTDLVSVTALHKTQSGATRGASVLVRFAHFFSTLK